MKYSNGRDDSVDIKNGYPNIYRFPNDGSVLKESTIHWWKLEEGNKSTLWVPNGVPSQTVQTPSFANEFYEI